MALTPTEIKIRLLKRGVSLAELARKWGTQREKVSRVIHRQGRFVYPEIRQKLARYLNVPVAAVGQDPKRKRRKPGKDAKAA